MSFLNYFDKEVVESYKFQNLFDWTEDFNNIDELKSTYKDLVDRYDFGVWKHRNKYRGFYAIFPFKDKIRYFHCDDEIWFEPFIRLSRCIYGGLSEEECQLLINNGRTQIIAVIKLVRNRTGLGLKESKDIVDQWINSNKHLLPVN